MQLFSRLLTTFGCLLLLCSVYLFFERINPNNLAFPAYGEEQAIITNDVSPQIISLPSIGKTLPILPSVIKGDSWETTSSGISHLSSSPTPGEKGNSILYGHNWPNLLGDLRKVKPGETFTITLSDGSIKSFTVAYVSVISSANVAILEQSKDSRVTLYTCTGFLDSKRLVVTAILAK